MQRRFSSILTAAVICLATISLTSIAKAADPTGTWKWSQPGRNGGDPVQISLKLKLDGEKVTGTLTRPGRDGNAVDIEIKEGKIKGDEVSFVTSIERNGNTFTTKYEGKVSADAIKGKIHLPGRNGAEGQTRDWEAKREAKK